MIKGKQLRDVFLEQIILRMEDNMENRGDSFVQKWHSVYFFIPVFEKPIQMPSLERFLEALEKKFGKVQPLAATPEMPKKAQDILGFLLWDYPVYNEKEEKMLPSQLVLYGADSFDQGLWNEQIIAQFWDCGDNREKFVCQCQYSIMCSNMMAALLPITEQYQIIADYADMILELFPDCIGIYWPHSQRLVPREVYQQQHWNLDILHFLDGGIQVRFFNISGTDEMLFDTLGFTAIGLPDLQCHCRELDPNSVVNFLNNIASYLYQNGDIIEDGNTIEGIDHDKWVCRREDSMVGPKRMVLDICPGRFAGGGRSK